MNLFAVKTATRCGPAARSEAPPSSWAWAALCWPWHAQAASETSDMGVWLMSQLGVVALLAAGVWAALYVIKQRKRVGGVAPNSLRVMGSTSLGTRERAVMLQAGERVFLLGVTAQSVSLISELEPPSPPKPAATREPDKPTSPSPDAP